jgi:hypothetical protein
MAYQLLHKAIGKTPVPSNEKLAGLDHHLDRYLGFEAPNASGRTVHRVHLLLENQLSKTT